MLKRFEVVKIITYWKQTAQSNEKIGWMLRDHQDDKDYGYTFEEAWQLIQEYGGVNVVATIRKTKSREIKELVPIPPNPGFMDTSWQIKFEDTNHLTYSPSCLEKVNSLIRHDQKRTLLKRREPFLRSQKELTSTWRKDRNIINCIELAQQIQKAQHLVIYVGASVWREIGLSGIYASDVWTDQNHFENLFRESIVKELTKLNIDAGQDLVDFPFVFDFLKMVKNLNTHSKVLFEIEEGIFQKREIGSSIDLAMAIGTELPNIEVEGAIYIGFEPCKDPSRYKMILQAPITHALKEVESHFVMKGRMMCSVCGDKVAHSIGSSGIAPVTIAICYSCGSKGAEPYGILVTRVADLLSRRPDYKLSPRLWFVKQATLSVTGISEEKFREDVRAKLKQIMRRKKNELG